MRSNFLRNPTAQTRHLVEFTFQEAYAFKLILIIRKVKAKNVFV